MEQIRIMGKRRLLHIITRLDKGGSAENTLLTVAGLNKNIYDVTLVTGKTENPYREAQKRAEREGVKIFAFPQLVREIDFYRDLVAFFKLYSFIKEGKFHIVHTHSSKAGISGRLASWLAKVPVIVHTPHGHVFYGYFGKTKANIFIFLEKVTAKFTDRIVALTDKETKEHIDFKVAPEEKFVTIHSGVELEKFFVVDIERIKNELRREFRIPEENLVAGSLGRLDEVKGYEYFVKAASIVKKAFPKVTFLLVGEGKKRVELEDLVKSEGLSGSFIFTGWRDDVPRMLSGMDIFVLSSLNEGMGRVLVEAMAVGLPIVATDVGGVRELVQDGVNGYLVPSKGPEAMAGKIVELLRDEVKRKSMGEAGKSICKSYSSEAMVGKIEKLYDKLWREKKLE